MAKNNNQLSTSRNTADNTIVCCMNCQHSNLHRYGSNPILAACKCKPQYGNKRHPYQIEIASIRRNCSYWAFEPNQKKVEQRTKAA